LTETEAVKDIEGQLAKSPRRGVKAEADADTDADVDAEVDVEDADGDDSAVADEAA
jgi:CarD family transcriptional regulator